jgi:alkaline phosphatase D
VTDNPNKNEAEASGRELTRRDFLVGSARGVTTVTLVGIPALPAFPAIAVSGRPLITHGVQTGDVTADGAILWSRADRPARMRVEVAATEAFRNARTLSGPAALEDGDFTAKLRLTGLPPGEEVFYRVSFVGLDSDRAVSEPVVGRLRTAPALGQRTRRDVSFVWTGDTAGQGWGINDAWGGMRGYEAMRHTRPDFFLNSGDLIYADGPITAEVKLADGTLWKNRVTDAKSKVAETLAEFRGCYQYNLLDENFRRFLAEVPMLAQWDDHETRNNWFPGQILDDSRYSVKSVDLLAARASRAFRDYVPLSDFPEEPGRVYRKVAYGPLLDVFLLDMRTYRAANSPNAQEEPGPDTALLGPAQLAWLKREMDASRAAWKVIAADMPLGLVVGDGPTRFEAVANGDNGPPRGREWEIADLLAFLKKKDIRNTVWLTADVHYTAAHHYDPARARFTDFLPFWEFVSGPIHAGTFGPNALDATFGPQVRFVRDTGKTPNRPPSDGLQFFGHVKIAADTRVLTVTLKDIAERSLFTIDLPAARR